MKYQRKNKRFSSYRYLLLIAGILVLSSIACDNSDQYGDLRGTVYVSGGNNERLSGVTIYLVGRSVVSASDGSYSFTGIPVGEQELAASKAGYETYTAKVKISSDPNEQRTYSFGMVYIEQ